MNDGRFCKCGDQRCPLCNSQVERPTMTNQPSLEQAKEFYLASFGKGAGRSAYDPQVPALMIAFAQKVKEDALLEVLNNPPKHQFWGAGDPDCPKDIKASNGELHTLRCKLCDDPKSVFCKGAYLAAKEEKGE